MLRCITHHLSLSLCLRLSLSLVSLTVRVLTFLLGKDAAVAVYPHMLGRAVHSVVAAMRKTKHNTAFSTGLGE